jgi:hypothetical protein
MKVQNKKVSFLMCHLRMYATFIQSCNLFEGQRYDARETWQRHSKYIRDFPASDKRNI